MIRRRQRATSQKNVNRDTKNRLSGRRMPKKENNRFWNVNRMKSCRKYRAKLYVAMRSRSVIRM